MTEDTQIEDAIFLYVFIKIKTYLKTVLKKCVWPVSLICEGLLNSATKGGQQLIVFRYMYPNPFLDICVLKI